MRLGVATDPSNQGIASMSSTNATVSIQVLASEVFTASEVASGANEADRTIKSTVKLAATLTSTTTPSVTKPPVYKSLAATATIDLTAVQAAAMPNSATRSVDMTGAKVVGAVLKAGAANASAVNIAPGASNPYPLFGTANDIDLKPGMVVAIGLNGVASQLPAVSSTVKNIDVTISGSDTVEILLLLGA